MNHADNKIRKQWLLCYGLSMMAFLCGLIFQVRNDPMLDLLPQGRYGHALSTLFVYCVFGYITYRCAYKKPGTKLLMTCLVLVVPSLIITPILYLKGIIQPPAYIPYYGVYLLASQGLSVWWVIASWRMRKVNKRLQCPSTPSS